MTKLEVLHRLRQAGGEYVSSAVLCEELHLSRNSVWKAVNRLREEGYPITAVTNRAEGPRCPVCCRAGPQQGH